MGQGEVLKFLEKNKGNWFTTKQIAEAIGKKNVVSNLRCLYTPLQRFLYHIERKEEKVRANIVVFWRVYVK